MCCRPARWPGFRRRACRSSPGSDVSSGFRRDRSPFHRPGHHDQNDQNGHNDRMACTRPPWPPESKLMPSAIELRGVTKRFLTPSGAVFTALRDLDMAVEPGEFCAVVGPTGCGKSTTLALISGLQPPSEGEGDGFGEPVTVIAQG